MSSLVGSIKHKVAKRLAHARTKLFWAWQNRAARKRLAKEVLNSRQPVANLLRYERRVSSQHGEDGILEAIFAKIGTTNKFFVEFGVGSGRQCNTAWLYRKHGWTGVWMDGAPGKTKAKRPPILHTEMITAENINGLFEKYGVPSSFDLLSIDIDGNDYWVWQKIVAYQPRVVVMEYNASIPPDQARTIAYDPHFVWQRTDYFGASLLALANLGQAKNYSLVACDSAGVNAFFVDSALAKYFVLRPVAELYRPPAYRAGQGHRPDARKMIPVSG